MLDPDKGAERQMECKKPLLFIGPEEEMERLWEKPHRLKWMGNSTESL